MPDDTLPTPTVETIPADGQPAATLTAEQTTTGSGAEPSTTELVELEWQGKTYQVPPEVAGLYETGMYADQRLKEARQIRESAAATPPVTTPPAPPAEGPSPLPVAFADALEEVDRKYNLAPEFKSLLKALATNQQQLVEETRAYKERELEAQAEQYRQSVIAPKSPIFADEGVWREFNDRLGKAVAQGAPRTDATVQKIVDDTTAWYNGLIAQWVRSQIKPKSDARPGLTPAKPNAPVPATQQTALETGLAIGPNGNYWARKNREWSGQGT